MTTMVIVTMLHLWWWWWRPHRDWQGASHWPGHLREKMWAKSCFVKKQAPFQVFLKARSQGSFPWNGAEPFAQKKSVPVKHIQTTSIWYSFIFIWYSSKTFIFGGSLVKLTFFAWTFTTTMLTFDKKRQDQKNWRQTLTRRRLTLSRILYERRRF